MGLNSTNVWDAACDTTKFTAPYSNSVPSRKAVFEANPCKTKFLTSSVTEQYIKLRGSQLHLKGWWFQLLKLTQHKKACAGHWITVICQI